MLFSDRILVPALFLGPALLVLVASVPLYQSHSRLQTQHTELQRRLQAIEPEWQAAQAELQRRADERARMEELMTWQRYHPDWAPALRAVVEAEASSITINRVRLLSTTRKIRTTEGRPALRPAYRWQVRGSARGEGAGGSVAQALNEVNRVLPEGVPPLQLLNMDRPPLPFDQDELIFWWRGDQPGFKDSHP